MRKDLPKASPSARRAEHGGAGVKFLLVVLVLFLLAHAGYNYIPAAYQAEDYKQRMGEVVTQAYAMPYSSASSLENVKTRLRRHADDEQIPADAVIKVDKLENNAMRAQVRYVKEIELLPFGLYKYKFQFDHTAQPSGFLTKQ